MAAISFKQQCPSCEMMVPIKDSNLIGRKIDCPQCKYRFVVGEPSAKVDDAAKDLKKKPKSSVSVTAKPADKGKGPPAKTKPKRRPGEDEEPVEEAPDVDKKSTKSSAKLMLGLGLASVAVVLLAVAGIFLLGGDDTKTPRKGGHITKITDDTIKPKPKEVVKAAPTGPELPEVSNHLPGDTEVVLNVSVKESLRSLLGRTLFDGARGFKPEDIQKMIGFSVEDVDRVVVGANLTQDWGLIVVRTSSPVKFDAVKAALNLKPAEGPIRGQDYFLTKVTWHKEAWDALRQILLNVSKPDAKAGGEPLAVRLHDPQTLVLADMAPMKRFLEVKGRPAYKSDPGPVTPSPIPAAAAAEGEPAAPETPPPSKLPYLTIDPRLKDILEKLEAKPPFLLSLAMSAEAIRFAKDGKQSVVRTAGYSVRADAGLSLTRIIECISEEFAATHEMVVLPKEVIGPMIDALKTLNLAVSWGQQAKTDEPKPDEKKPDDPKKPEKPVDERGTVTIEGPKRIDNSVHLLVTIDEPAYRMLEVAVAMAYLLRERGKLDMAQARPHPHDLGKAGRAYSEKNQRFPTGTVDRPVPTSRMGRPWAPDDRVSWMADLLPFLGRVDLHRQIQFKKSWHDLDNMNAAMNLIPYFLDPKQPSSTWYARYPGLPNEVAATHFVGMAGVGLDAASYADSDPAVAKKRGIFGYDRTTKLADIGDLATTIFMIQVPPVYASPWIAGGGSTIRGVPETKSVQPFVCTLPDGKRGTFAVMADGSVRFIAENISDSVFKALSVVDKDKPKEGLDAVPVVPPTADRPELKTQPPAAGK